MDSPTPFFSDRVLPNALRRLSLPPIALRAIGKATELFGLVHGQNLGGLRSSKDPLQRAYGTARSTRPWRGSTTRRYRSLVAVWTAFQRDSALTTTRKRGPGS